MPSELVSQNQQFQDLDLDKVEIPKLNPQEKHFCFEYLVDYDHRRAAVAVGLKPERGIRWIRRPEISKFIHQANEVAARESLISKDMVEFELMHKFLPAARGEVPIRGVSAEGGPYCTPVTNMAAWGRGLELMAKHSGYNGASAADASVTININHEALGIVIEGEKVDG